MTRPYTPETLAPTIVSVAVHAYGVIWTMPRPARHHHVLEAIDAAGLCAMDPGPEAQGFLTSDGRFVGRDDAANIAVAAGQIVAPKWPPDLYSEDLW